jgi:hypothetical protein
MSLFILNRLDVLIKRIEQLITAVTGQPPPELPPSPPPYEIVRELLPNTYKQFELDLSVGRTDVPLGVRDLLVGTSAKYASYMTIVAVPNPFTFKVNDTSNSAISATVGLEWADFEIKEIYISNVASAGTAIIIVEWRAE